MKCVFWVFCLVLAAVSQCSQSAKILVFVPMPWRSHHFVFQTVIKALADREHQIDYLTPMPLKNPPPNVKHLMIEDKLHITMPAIAPEEMKQVWSPMVHYAFRGQIMDALTDILTSESEIKKLLESNEKYDLVLTECQLIQEIHAVWSHKFNASHVSLMVVDDFPFTNHLNGLSDNPSYNVDLFDRFTDRMNFGERLINTVGYLANLAINSYMLKGYQQLADEVLRYPGWEGRPLITDLASDMALVLVNSHVAVSYAVPRAPHVKEIGGMTLTGATELPQDLQSFLDGANEGFVYFSLGSNVDMRIMTRDGKLQELFEAFGALKQKVLLKWTGSDLPKTDNQKILIQPWFPQLGILNHKNIKVFITHGGMQSTVETVNYGVPVVGIPIFADQPKNIRFLVTKGCGVEIDKFNITKDSLLSAINEVVSNPSYKEAVMKRSAILKDAPMKYIDQAVYWIEYVHKHGKVLQPASVRMPFFQVYLLDVAAVLFLAIAISSYLTVRSIKALWSFVFSRTAANKSKKNKKD